MTYSYLDLVRKVDVAPYFHEETEHQIFRDSVYELVSHDHKFKLGYLLPLVVNQLQKHNDTVEVNHSRKTVTIIGTLDSVESRSNAFATIASNWRSQNLFDTLKGWRDERYTVYGPNREPYMHLERAFCPLLGVAMYGVHINGYIPDRKPESYQLWVPRRSATKATYPGMLDNTVAGGLGYPYGCYETCVKECYEEAGLDAQHVAENLKSVGLISYLYQLKKGDYESELGLVQPELEYIYDLDMTGVTPKPVDHEAEDFRLMSVAEVCTRLKNGEFKPNCAGVIVDFLIRIGYITPENEPDFIEINNRLHRLLPFPTK